MRDLRADGVISVRSRRHGLGLQGEDPWVPEGAYSLGQTRVGAGEQKVAEADSPAAFVTVAVIPGGVSVSMHGEGVHSTSLCEASDTAGPRVPVLVDQVMVSARACGSAATTRKVTRLPENQRSSDWKVLVMRGAAVASAGSRAARSAVRWAPRTAGCSLRAACPARPSAPCPSILLVRAWRASRLSARKRCAHCRRRSGEGQFSARCRGSRSVDQREEWLINTRCWPCP